MSDYLDDLRKTVDAVKSVCDDKELPPEQALLKIKKLLIDNKPVSCWFGFDVETCGADEFYNFCKMHCDYKDRMKGISNETK